MAASKGKSKSGKGKAAKSGKGSRSGKTAAKRRKGGEPSQNARLARLITGMVFAIVAIYTLVVLISYIFTWTRDQSLITNASMMDSDVIAWNSGGKLGFLWADFLVSKLFGLGAFTVPFFLGAIAVHCFRIRRVNLLRVFILSLFGAVIFSVFFAYLFRVIGFGPKLAFGAGGSYGNFSSEWLCNMLGEFGAGCVIFVALLLWIFFLSRKVAIWFDDLLYNTSHRPEKVDADYDPDDYPVEITDGEDSPDLTGLEGDGGLDDDADEIPLPLVATMEADQDDSEIDDDSGDDEDDPVPSDRRPEPENDDDDISADNVEITVEESENDFLANLTEDQKNRLFDPRLDLPKYQLPPLSLLNDYREQWYEVSRDELEKNKQRIVNALANYKIRVVGITAKMGPTVTLYKIHLAEGIKIAQVRRLEEDIALSLGAKGVRVVTLLDSVGIEVPNEKASVVALKSILNSPQFKAAKMELPLAMGITVTNEPFFIDLAKMPHLLVAGATGMGKSVGLNCIISSLIYTKHPSEMKFVMVDPKKVELSLYSKLEKHYLAMLPAGDEAIITDTKLVVNTLKSLCIEMEDRYSLLKLADVRQIRDYNEKFLNRRLNPNNGHKYLPYIVVIIDEFADLLMTAGRDVEEPIARLAQKARAVGIHLVIATQRPTTDIITGTIKANFNSRIAFRVNSMVDSRTILDSPGANRLIGRGDMLVLHPGADLTRVQCALIDTPEIISLTKFVNEQRGYEHAFYLPEYVDESEDAGGAAGVDLVKRDKLFEEAAKIVVQYQQGSTSLLQRKLNLGYNRAGRLIDQLEAAGIVGPFEGSKARNVLITDFDTLDRKLESLDHQTIV